MKPINLTEKLALAIAKAENWSEACFLQVLSEMITILSGSRLDWDSDAGEEWGRVLFDDLIVAILRVNFPFCVVHEYWQVSLTPILKKRDIVALSVQDLEAKIFCIDPSAVSRLFGRDSITGSIDLEKFSINELWWATI